MELRKTVTKSVNSRIILERADNGIILSELGEDGAVNTKMVYETYYKDGSVDFFSVEELLIDLLEYMKIPTEEPFNNTMLTIEIEKIDESLPSDLDEDIDNDEEEDDE